MEMRVGTSIGEFDRFVDKLPEKVRRSPWFMFIPVTENNASDDPKERAPKKDKHRLNPEDGRRRMENGKNVGIVLRDQLSIPDVIDEEEAEVYLEDLP
ncbi:hypothetical protein AKJ41_01085 [candidate division MSBL1 archaeon SCGC-AAA259O05]|uniref:Uncharacterized protein n=1 Tax=candidate division MSBL1 archaeon SCGC-AAA259O05 TaxID=1698271 RepID=A0A133V544_9EURY|nr:hypothetical protein AKJ41_01085 [candidate division MSBL1 archaeon SCGC-AAA259O05]